MIEVLCDHPERCPDTDRLHRRLEAVLAGEGRTAAEVTVVLAARADVLDLNRAYLGHDFPTDVLSFWLGADDGTGPVEGEVYVDLDTAQQRCAEFGASFEDEVARYAIHGVLHLCGYDDATPAQKAVMHAREDRYLLVA